MDTPEEQLKTYILERFLGKRNIPLDENTPLVSSGLIDSMALVELLAKLEDVTALRIPAGKIRPQNMDSIRLMLATARRVGKPRT